MASWPLFLAPFVLLMPGFPVPGEADHAKLGADKDRVVELEQAGTAKRDWTAFQPWTASGYPHQVRIEQRVVVRIAPARPRNSLVADLPRNFPDRLAERKMEKCVPLKGVAGVQTGGPSRLILFLKDRRMVSAELEKACRARDFYSGFYVEPSSDGNLCVKRDKLQSRTGVKCEFSQFRQLVMVRD